MNGLHVLYFAMTTKPFNRNFINVPRIKRNKTEFKSKFRLLKFISTL